MQIHQGDSACVCVCVCVLAHVLILIFYGHTVFLVTAVTLIFFIFFIFLRGREGRRRGGGFKGGLAISSYIIQNKNEIKQSPMFRDFAYVHTHNGI